MTFCSVKILYDVDVDGYLQAKVKFALGFNRLCN